MRKFFNARPSKVVVNISLLILRLGIGGLMLVHGIPKVEQLFGPDPVQFAEIFGMSAVLSLALAAFAEFLCSIFIILGLFTRLATIPLIITMLIAVFVVHADDPFIRQELGLHYLLVYLVLLIAGSGKYALDAIFFKPKRRRYFH